VVNNLVAEEKVTGSNPIFRYSIIKDIIMAKSKKRTGILEIEGINKKFILSKISPINSDKAMGIIHLEGLKDDTWRMLYSSKIIKDLSLLSKIIIIREGNDRRIKLDGLGTELELSKVTELKIKSSKLVHLDELYDGTWRITYSASVIEDMTRVKSFNIIISPP
jgi:hypothetical protein